MCQKLYGSAYSASDLQDPAGFPSSAESGAADFIAGTIQAGNTLSVNSPTLTNTGNVIGQSVALTGVTLTNGITNPNVYTPPPAISKQVVPLGPVANPSGDGGVATHGVEQATSVTGAGGLNPNSPAGVQTVGKPVAPSVTQASAPGSARVSTLGAVDGPGPASVGQVNPPAATSVQVIKGKSYTVNYLTNNPAANVMGTITPASLLASLPAALQPANVPFYYDPYSEDQLVEQAALTQTGKDSFYNTTSAADSTAQVSIETQDKAALYGAANAYAMKNNIALGTQLSQAQLALIDQPMLWYVQQAVPEPGCTPTGGAVCPSEQALVPEVLLPANYASVSADGEIAGNSVTLNYADSILNTGTITAQDLTINTGKLSNETRSTNVGTIYQEVDTGVEKTTGTVLEQGGVLSSSSYAINAKTINDAGTIQKTNADGSFDAAGTAAMLADLKTSLGSNFTQLTPSNNLNTTFIADGGMGPIIAIQIVLMVAISVVTAGAASAELASLQAGAADTGMATMAAGGSAAEANAAAGVLASSTFAAGGVANAAAAGAVAGLSSAAASQFMSLSPNAGAFVKSTAIAGLTAGLTDGLTFDGSGVGFDISGSPDSLVSLSGAQSLGSTLVPQAGASTSSNILTQGVALLGSAGVQASVQTSFGDGSFLTNLKNDGAADLAAAGAYAIGDAKPWLIANLGSVGGEGAYIAAHGLLGCAAGAATGAGCGGGAIGGALSAGLNPLINSSGNLPPAVLASVETLVGGGIAGALGYNVQGAVTAAQNETLNNFCDHNSCGQALSAFASKFSDTLAGSMQSQEAAATAGAPSYISFAGSGMGIEYGASLNLYDGQVYFGLGKAAPFSTSGSLVLGYILSPSDNPALSTDNFLNGGSATAGGCMVGLCAGLNQSIGGSTSFEMGIGTPGLTTGVSVSKPVSLGGSK